MRFFWVFMEEHIRLSLNALLYVLLCLRCGACAEVQFQRGCVSVGF